MPDETRTSKKPVGVIVVVLLLCAVAAVWFVLKSRRAKTPTVPPVAVLRIDSIDETNRVATLSDNGSHAANGTLQSWRIAWGDGNENNLSSMPQKAAHTYSSEGDYTISLWCIDNRGATSSPPAMTNITFDFLKRQKAAELAQAEAQREAERLKQEQARKEAERLEQERQKELAAQKARAEAEAARKKAEADAELARQTANKAPEPLPPPTSPYSALGDENPANRSVIFTPRGSVLGEFQISKEKTEGIGSDGNLAVILVIRCVNFPNTPISTTDWQIDGKSYQLVSSRIRAYFAPGKHDVSALLAHGSGSQSTELKADVTVRTNGECSVTPTK